MAVGHVSTKLSEWLVVILICFSLVVEFLLHRVEHWINHRHHHLQSVVKVLYRELMILGLVSFIFVIFETVEKPDGDTVLSFEFAHFFIFLLAVFYTMVVLCSMLTSLRLSARWKKMEQVDLVKYLHLKEQYTHIRSHIHKHHGAPWRWFWWWFPNFPKLWNYMQLHEMMAFHDIRFQFIYYRNLPEHFRFSSFLRKVKSITFVHLVESHWSLYAIFLIIVLGDLLRRYTVGSPAEEGGTDVVESAFIIAAAILLMIFVQLLAVKIRGVYWELTKNPRTYYEGVHPTAVAEELAVAEARLEEERVRRRRTRSADGPVDDPGEVADDEATDAPRGSSTDSPEAEMLVPMHLQKNTTLGGPKADLTASHRRSRSSNENGILAEVSPVNYRVDGNQNVPATTNLPSNLVPYNKPHVADQKIAVDELKDIAYRHSLDYKAYAAKGSRSAGHSLEYARANRSPTQEINGPMEFHEIASRHSLETPQNASANLQQMGRASREAFVAKAAVEAARRRTAEGEFTSRRSLDDSQRMSDGRRPGEFQRPGEVQRPIVDTVMRVGSPRIMSRLSSRGVSTDNDPRAPSSDYGRGSGEGRGFERRSIELAAALPREELAVRHHLPYGPHGDRDIEAGIVRPESGGGAALGQSGQPSPGRRSKRIRFLTTPSSGGMQPSSKDGPNASGDSTAPGMMRHKSRGFMNATIIRNLEHQEKAKTMQPADYPWIVKKLIPRLGRVASPVEKLFWFGSHQFFLWCVEFCLFFSTVLLAASSASLALIALEKDPITGLHIASLVLSSASLLFVLLRIAGIIKKYIFILNNASLIPESLAIEAIHRVSKKSMLRVRVDESSDLSGTETEREEEQSAVERRKTLGRFFRSEAESGNMPGIDVPGRGSGRLSLERPFLRAQRRRSALRRRTSRLRTSRGHIPSVPTAGQGKNSAETNASN